MRRPLHVSVGGKCVVSTSYLGLHLLAPLNLFPVASFQDYQFAFAVIQPYFMFFSNFHRFSIDIK